MTNYNSDNKSKSFNEQIRKLLKYSCLKVSDNDNVEEKVVYYINNEISGNLNNGIDGNIKKSDSTDDEIIRAANYKIALCIYSFIMMAKTEDEAFMKRKYLKFTLKIQKKLMEVKATFERKYRRPFRSMDSLTAIESELLMVKRKILKEKLSCELYEVLRENYPILMYSENQNVKNKISDLVHDYAKRIIENPADKERLLNDFNCDAYLISKSSRTK